MSKFFEGLIKILAFGVLLVFGISYISSIPQTYRYKITVEIETPQGIKSGSAVREVRVWNNWAKYVNPDVRSLTYRVVGEAVAIDLGEQGILFHLNNWDSNALISNAFPRPKNSKLSNLEYYKQLEIGTRTVQAGWRSFVWLDSFENENVLQRLDSKDFQTKFGNGFRLKQTTIEITNEAVTWNIDPLLTKINNGGKWGSYNRQPFQFK